MRIIVSLFVVTGLLLSASAALGAEKPKALIFAWDDAGAAAAILRDAGMDIVQANRSAVPSFDGIRLVVLSADAPVADSTAEKIRTLVRGGGGLLVVHTSKDSPNFWWDTYRRVGKGQPDPSPLWDVLPFVAVPISDQTKRGLHNPFGPTRVLRQADSPLLAGVDLRQAPPFPYHAFMVLPTHSLVQNTHVMFAWSEDQYKSPLWGNGQVLAWGDDPEQRPLLLKAEYGAGRCFAAAVPLFENLQWPGSRAFVKNVTTWLLGDQQATPGISKPVYGLGVPWIAQQSLQGMGFSLKQKPQDAQGALVYERPTAEQAKALAGLASANKPVVIANVAALQVSPLKEMVNLKPMAAPAAASSAGPQVTLDKRPVWTQPQVVSDIGWAVDADNAAVNEKWFTPDGAASVEWQPAEAGDTKAPASEQQRARAKRVVARPRPNARAKRGGSADDLDHAVAAALVAPPQVKDDKAPALAWSKTYRWRSEGSILDRRDMVEGWEQVAFNDSTWAEQAMGQEPPLPKLAGVTAPSQSLMAGAMWARARLTVKNAQASRSWLMPSAETQFVTILDGKPLKEPVAIRTLSEGEHAIAVRAWPLQHPTSNTSENPWGSPIQLQWPTIIDSPWQYHDAQKGEADGFFSAYHTDWISSDPGQSRLHRGAGWYQVTMDAKATRLPIEIADAPRTDTNTKVWLDGKPLGNLPVVVDLPQMSVGNHVLTLLAGDATPLVIKPHANVWYKATVRMAADSPWNAFRIEDAGNALVYVNGRQVSAGQSGYFLAPWKSGDNLLVIGNLEQKAPPAIRLVQAPAAPAAADVKSAERLQGVWYRREDPQHQALSKDWLGALKNAAPPEAWTAIVADSQRGVIASIDDERPCWFATPFQVSASEAQGPARIVIDTTGDGAPGDLVKNVWVNGQRIPARLEFVSTQRYEKDSDKQTTISFILSGHLKAGTNWLAFPLDIQEYYRMRFAAPSETGRWPVPLPKLDLTGSVDALVWSEPLTRLNGNGLVRRGQVMMPPADAMILARFSDGAPAVARVGNITFATTDQSQDWSQWIDDATRYDWIVTKDGSMRDLGAGMAIKRRNQGSGNPVQADGAEIAAALLRNSVGIVGADPATGGGGGASVHIAPAQQTRILGYQLRNWTGMVLSEGRVNVPAGATQVAVPAPVDDPSPMTTQIRRDCWLRAALLENNGAIVSDYVELRVDGSPAVDVLLSPTDSSGRDLPSSIAGAPGYDPINVRWSLAAGGPGDPIVVAGERIRLRVMCRNTTAQPQQVALDLAWEGSLESTPVAISPLRFTLAPFEQRTEVVPCGFRVADMKFAAGNDMAGIRTAPDDDNVAGFLSTGRVVARADNNVASELALIAVRPWKRFAPGSTQRPAGQFGSPGGFDMEQFGRTASLDTLADPKHRWYGSDISGMYCSAIDWWRDYFMNTRGSGGGFGGFNGSKAFAWGPCDDAMDRGSTSLDNASYLPDGTQYQEFLYAGLSREYNRFLRGTQPLLMSIADYWANFGLPTRERNNVQFLRWRREQGRPLNVSTEAELIEVRRNDPTVRADWQRFNEEAHVAWSKQYMAGMPPESVSFSQGESLHFLFNRAHDDFEMIRGVLASNNSVVFQPMDISRRGELHFGWMRAMYDDMTVRNDAWNHTDGNPQTLGQSFGSGGTILTTPEMSRLSTLDNGFMVIRDSAGEAQPVINVPINEAYMAERSRIPLLNGSKRTGSLPVELIGRDQTFHLCSLIQPERVLGYFVVTPLERIADDKLDGHVVNFRSKPDAEPVAPLTHMLRNYGVLWGGVLAPDRIDRLKPGEGALYLMPSGTGDAEAKSLVDLVQRGGSASIFFSTGGTKTKETPLSTLFNIKYAPLAADAHGGISMPGVGERPAPAVDDDLPQYVAAGPGKDQIQGTGAWAGRALLRTAEEGNGKAMFSALNCGENWGWDHDLARQVAKAVNWAAGNPVTLPDGVSGYAFEAKGMTFLVLQDLKYTGGPAAIHFKAPAGNYAAADLFSGRPVKFESSDDGLTLHPTLLSNGGSVVVIKPLDKR